MEVPIRTVMEVGVLYQGQKIVFELEFGATCVVHEGDRLFVVGKDHLRMIQRAKMNSLLAKSYRNALKSILPHVPEDCMTDYLKQLIDHLGKEPL